MNDKERRPGRLGRIVIAASILVTLLLLDFPQGVPGALAQEPLGEPSELDEDDDLPTDTKSKSKRVNEDDYITKDAAEIAAPPPVILPPPVENEAQPVGGPAVSDTNEEDDEESRHQPCGSRGDEPDMSAAPDPSPLSEDDDEASPAAIDDAASSGPEEMPDEFD